MSFEERKAWVYLAVAVVGYGAYLALALTALATDPTVIAEANYAAAMLSTIGGAIVVGILANIAVATVTPHDAQKTDQRDRDIARLGEHVGQAFLVIGGVAALVLALVRAEHFWIANVIYLGFVLSAVAIIAMLTIPFVGIS